MPDLPTLTIFIAASLALLITPGPAVLYIVARSIDQGRRAGIVSVLGIAVGSLVHVAGAALGLSALLVSSALAFNLVKLLGAAYLVYLGVRKLLEKVGPIEYYSAEKRKLGRIFRQGIVVNILNPKTALFFFTFLPQFVDPARGPVAAQALLLGGIFVTLAVCSDSVYALLAGTLRGVLAHSRTFLRAQRYVAGGLYITLGVTTALSGSGSHSGSSS